MQKAKWSSGEANCDYSRKEPLAGGVGVGRASRWRGRGWMKMLTFEFTSL